MALRYQSFRSYIHSNKDSSHIHQYIIKDICTEINLLSRNYACSLMAPGFCWPWLLAMARGKSAYHHTAKIQLNGMIVRWKHICNALSQHLKARLGATGKTMRNLLRLPLLSCSDAVHWGRLLHTRASFYTGLPLERLPRDAVVFVNCNSLCLANPTIAGTMHSCAGMSCVSGKPCWETCCLGPGFAKPGWVYDGIGSWWSQMQDVITFSDHIRVSKDSRSACNCKQG